MRYLRWLVVALLVAPAFAAIAVVQEKDGTSNAITLTSASTIASDHGLHVLTSSATAGTVTLGAQTAVHQGACTAAVSSLVLCSYYIFPITVSSTTVTCTSCGTFNAIVAVEYSGVSGVEPIVGCFSGLGSVICQTNNAGTVLGQEYKPGYSAEGITFFATCSGSSTAPTMTGLSGGGTATPNGNPAGWGISSGTTLTSMKPISGCNQSNAEAIAFIGAGSTQQPVVNPNQREHGTQVASGNATAAATIFNVGDLVTIWPWCISTCGITTLTLGAQNAICPASAQGISNTAAGQPGICYVIANATGALTVTFTPSGSPTGYQVAYQDFTVSANTTAKFDTAATASCQSACSEGTNVVLPSVTPAQTGSLLLNYVSTGLHANGPHTGAPQWSCYAFIGAADSQNCMTQTTVNLIDWILSSASGATNANADVLISNDAWQSVVASFSLSNSSVPRMTLVGVGP